MEFNIESSKREHNYRDLKNLRHLSEALAKCHALRGLIFTGG